MTDNFGAGAVEVVERRDGMTVKFPYHPDMVARIKRVAGVEFSEKQRGFIIPKESMEAARKALEDVRAIAGADHEALQAITVLANSTARLIMTEKGVAKGIKPQVSTFHKRDHSYRGEIINSNGRYAAQLTGFGKDDGAAFVVVHRLADLNHEMFKGERFAVSYDDKGRATVEALPPEFDKTLGKEMDGVKVVEVGDKFHISFGFNPELSARLNRVAGVEFNQEARAYTALVADRTFVERAVNDMRKIYVAEGAELREMSVEAERRMDGAKVLRPLVRGGQDYKGEVVAVSDHFVLQHTGREYFTAHRIKDLDRRPEIGEQVKVKYQASRGQVLAAATKERGHGR